MTLETIFSTCLAMNRVVSKTKTEARSTQNSKTKHPNLENEAPKTRKRSTQNSKTKHPNLENEAPYLENEAPNNCFFLSFVTVTFAPIAF